METQILSCQKDKFSLNPETTYLNCAYMSPLMKNVQEAGISGINSKINPPDIGSGSFFADADEVRKEFGKMINADPKRIAIIPSVSYGIGNVTRNIYLDKGEEIVVAGEQFPSNYYPWKKLCDQSRATLKSIAAPASATRGAAWNEALLEAINDKTRAVAVSHTHWADGTLFDLLAIRKRTKDVGALLIVDGTQSVGALPFDVEKLQPDALICAGYKWLLGPYAIGLAYYGGYFDEGQPLEENWINRLNSENFSGLVNYEEAYQPGALRYEVGEHSNFILVPMLLEALKQINRWGVENIQDYCKSLLSFDGLQSLKLEDGQYRGAHLFGIRMPDADLNSIKNALAKEKISVSIRGTAVRVSPHLYNTQTDLRKLVTVLTTNR